MLEHTQAQTKILENLILGEGNVAFEDLMPFDINLQGNGSYRMRNNLRFSFPRNPLIVSGDRIRVIPHHYKDIYFWLDLMKMLPGTPEDQWLKVSSYRIFPELHKLTTWNWFGVERQLLVDYMFGANGIEFSDLQQINLAATNQRRIYLGSGSHSGPGNTSIVLPPNTVNIGDKLSVKPKEYKPQGYQWLEVHKLNETEDLTTERFIVSAGIIGGRLLSQWCGVERQLLKDYLNGAVRFNDLLPIPLQGNKSGSLSIVQIGRTQIKLSLSERRAIAEGSLFTLVPANETEGTLRFDLMLDQEFLGRYRFDLGHNRFLLEVLNPQQENSLRFDESLGGYYDNHGDLWFPYYILAKRLNIAPVTLVRHYLQGLESISYERADRGVILYRESEAVVMLEKSRSQRVGESSLVSPDDADEYFRRLIGG